ncbi:MAG: pilus assembly protein, partial [Anaerolineae bacterium]|nr:pilus assembly protein [Anaerolineae bacterium]
MRYLARNLEDHEKGQSLVESAMMFTVFLLVLSGVVDLGRAFFTLVALQEAATEGATYAAVHPSHTAVIRNIASTSSTAPLNLKALFDTGKLSIESQVQNIYYCAGVDASGNPHGIKVTVIYKLPLINPFGGL